MHPQETDNLTSVAADSATQGLRRDQVVESMIRRAQKGDPSAMNALLDHVNPIVSRICGGIALTNGPDASQEALILIFRNLKSLREPSAWRGWVVRIATREAVRQARTAAVTSTISDDSMPPAPGDDYQTANIIDTLVRLSPEHRAILVLRDVFGYPEEVSSAMLNIPPGTAKSRLSRARAMFRKDWE